MPATIRRYTPADLPAIVELSLLAWEPVFNAWQEILGPGLYELAITPDWHTMQAETVQKYCTMPGIVTVVAEVDGMVAGFLCYEIRHEAKVGEVQLLAVHPAYQNDGIGTELNLYALEQFRAAGMKLAVVGTGGDKGHAPARRSYEKAGYTGLPAVHYYQKL